MAKTPDEPTFDVTDTSQEHPSDESELDEPLSTADAVQSRMYLAIAVVIAAILRVPSYFADRHLTFDDGVFASSVLAMRDGGVPFREVFSSQGPLFLPLAFVGDLIGLRTSDSPRVLGFASGIALTIFVFLALRRIVRPDLALYGALIVGTSGCVMWVSGPLAADGPSLAFAAAAFWLTLMHRERPRTSTAVLIGLAVGASLSVKAMQVPLLAPVTLVLLIPLVNDLRAKRLAPRSMIHPVVAGGTAVALFVLVSLPLGLGRVVDQTLGYRTESTGTRHPIANLRKMLSTLWDRDLVLWLLVIVSILWYVIESRRRSDPAGASPVQSSRIEAETAQTWRPSPMLLSVLWLVLTVLWLAFVVSPMWRSHVSALVVPSALILAQCAPPTRWLAVLAVVCVPLALVQLDGLLVPGPYRGSERDVVELLQLLPPDAWVLSDEPGLAWKAGHRTTDDLVDPSMLRVQSGRYDEDSIVAAAADPKVCAVVVRSRQRFGYFGGLGARLSSMGYVVAQMSSTRTGDLQRVYVRADCSPPAG